MTKEQAYEYVRSEATDTQNGLMVHITIVEKAINAVAYEEELIEKAMDGVYNCEGNCADWVQLGDAEYFIDVALGVEDNLYI